MLTETQKDLVRDLCRRNKLGLLEFKENGLIYFTKTIPIKEAVLRTFPSFELVENGESPLMDDRTDDLRHVYWVTVRPDICD